MIRRRGGHALSAAVDDANQTLVTARPHVNARQVSTVRSDMEVADVLRLLQRDGRYLIATRASHRQYKHPVKPGRATVAGKPSDELALGTLNSAFKQAGLRRRIPCAMRS